MLHELKELPEHFADIVNGLKCFEVRKNDRDFKPWDDLALNEWQPDSELNGGGGYTGRYLLATIKKVYDYPEYLRPGYVILQLKGYRDYPLTKIFGEKNGGNENAG